MDPREELEALVGFDGRFAGTDAERRAAAHLADRLEALGREAEREPVDVWPAFHLTHAVHVLLAIAASVVSVSSPATGTALAFVAVVSTFGDATGIFYIVRRLTGRRASQNVVSPERTGKPGTLVLTAHYDAGRTGYLFRPSMRRVRVGGMRVLLSSMLVVLGCCALRLLGVDGTVVSVVQFVPTALLIVALPLLVDLALTRVVPGANDNASGVATVLRLAEAHRGRLEHFDLLVLLTCAQEAFALGMRGWLKRHRRELDRTRTVVVNVDEVGRGGVRYTTREGLLMPVKSHVQLVRLCEEVAEDSADEVRPIKNRAASDGYAARSAGFAAITITCRDALGQVPGHHRLTDTPNRVDQEALERAFGFCSELIERLDAETGPGLRSPHEETALSEAEDA
jgi:hypothetical protein